jgi:glc operon protein GlcG
MSQPDMIIAAPSIALAGAEAAIAAARSEATRRGVAVSVAVLDRGGHPVALARMDGIHIGTVAVATGKAKTAILYNRATSALAAALVSGGTGLLSLPDVIALPGGLPLLAGGAVVGAIGVSGAAPDVDEAIATAGASALNGTDNG